MTHFKTSVTVEEIFGLHPKKKVPDHNGEIIRFWFAWLPLGVVSGIFTSILTQNGAVWLPVAGVVALALWAADKNHRGES